MNLSDIVIILSRVADSGNTGAVCRAMKNMSLSRLRIVSPQTQLDEKTIVSRAIHAVDVWENAEFYDSLAKAAKDCSLLIGTTRRRGRKRKSITIDPHNLAEKLVNQYANKGFKGSVAIVFGNERTGLNDEELNLCNIASHIPVSDDFPSLNLSHAVQIYAYELFLAFSRLENDKDAKTDNESPDKPDKLTVKGEWLPLEREKVDETAIAITDSLESLGFYKNPVKDEQTRFIRDLISRAGLTEREAQYLANIFIKSGRLSLSK